MLRLTSLVTSGNIQNFGYTYDNSGNVLTLTDYLPATDQITTYTYDDLNRLLSASLPGVYSHAWTYNNIGNMLTRNDNNGNVSYLYNDAAHKHAVTQVGANYFCYDANGNMTRRNATSSSCTNGDSLSYDKENRLTSITVGANTTTYVYDGDGNRVKKTANGVSTFYVGNHYEVTSGIATKYYYFGKQRVAMRVGTNPVTYLHSDHLGSTSATSGASVSAQNYYAFGNIRGTTGTVPTDFGFTGQRRDASAGLLFYNARYYDSTLGRFISADTIVPSHFNPQDLNRYTYARNNPLRYTDPSGHCPICVVVVVVVGGLTAYDYLSNPDVAYASSTTTDLNALPDSDLPDNDIALCSYCYYGEHGEWGIAAVAGVVELTPFDEIPGANNVFRKIYKKLPAVVEIAGNKINRTSYYSRFNKWAESVGIQIGSGMARHHGLPRDFEAFFAKRGIDIHDPSNMFLLPSDLHTNLPNGIHTKTGNVEIDWNTAWEQWISDHRNASAKEIYDELDRLAKEFGIDPYRMGEYYKP